MEFLTKRSMSVFPHLPYYSLFSQLKIKLKSRHFDAIKAIDAKSYAMLNSLKDHDF
jgi:hypothetical protein